MKSFIYDWMGVCIGLAWGAAPVLCVSWVVDLVLGTRLVDWLYHTYGGAVVLVLSGAVAVTYLVRRGEIGTR